MTGRSAMRLSRLWSNDTDRPALVGAAGDGGEVVLSHRELRSLVLAPAPFLRRPKALVLVLATNTLECVVAYLQALAAGHAVALVDASLSPGFADVVIERYGPELCWGELRESDGSGGLRPVQGMWSVRDTPGRPVHPELALLLPTSGSTGSPKLVRLSAAGLAVNVGAIVSALSITADDVAATTLPISYSFGLSVLHTHLWAGAGVVLTGASVIDPAFWRLVASSGVSTFSGVPFTFEMLVRAGFADLDAPALRSLCQAGGAMAPGLSETVLDMASARGVELYVMYGQTEASPRMACVNLTAEPHKRGSVGPPLPGGRFEIEAADGSGVGPGVEGSVMYEGPNVMLGYAVDRGDLALGDTQGGRLRTGDVGHLDQDGYLWISGRASRFAKLFGHRVGLDDVENLAHELGRVAAVEGEGSLHVFHEPASDDVRAKVRRELSTSLHLPQGAVRLTSVERLPLLPNGKIDYRALSDLVRPGPVRAEAAPG